MKIIIKGNEKDIVGLINELQKPKNGYTVTVPAPTIGGSCSSHTTTAPRGITTAQGGEQGR